MGKRAFTTTLFFLGIILIGVFARMFVLEDSPLVNIKGESQTANTAEICEDDEVC